MTDHIPRHILPLARDYLDAFRVTVIGGARQVGKSTLAKMLMDGRQAVFYSLDNPAVLDQVRADPQTALQHPPGTTVVIDEAQLMPELANYIKLIVDEDNRRGQFLLTGSSDLMHSRGNNESLAGRAVTLTLHGFSQGEWQYRGSQPPEDIISFIVNEGLDAFYGFTSSYNRESTLVAMSQGSFPEAMTLPERVREGWMASYIDRLLNRDIQVFGRSIAQDRVHHVLRLLAANQSGELVYARIGQLSGIPERSIESYVTMLERVHAVTTLRPWRNNLAKREVGRRKAYLEDSSLALHLANVMPSALSTIETPILGGFVEGWVIQELIKQQGWTTSRFQLFHYRERNGKEVDAIVELGDGSVIAIEIKASSTRKTEHFNSLRWMQDQLGDRFRAGIVLSLVPEAFNVSDRLWGLPISALWEHPR